MPILRSKRATARFLAGIRCTLHFGDADHTCEAVDLSRQGVLVVGEVPEPADPTAAITLSTTAGDLSVRLVGRVVRVTDGEQPGTRSIGLQFVAPDEARLRGLNSLISRIVEGNAPGPLQSLKPGAKPKDIRAALDKMPVVHRMQLAARAMATERNYVREDTNPQVLDALARNPNINLSEVKLLVRNQALLVATLKRIAEDHRWKRDQELKVLLATHPRVTYALAAELVKEMTDRSLQQALRRPGLPVELKAGLLNPLTKDKLRR